MRSVIFQPRTE